MAPRSADYSAIDDAIREVLLYEWDPIGVADFPEARDEYDAYIPSIRSLLLGRASVEQITARLSEIEETRMGGIPPRRSLIPVATRLRGIEIGLAPT